jgi:hypothetical protein
MITESIFVVFQNKKLLTKPTSDAHLGMLKKVMEKKREREKERERERKRERERERERVCS